MLNINMLVIKVFDEYSYYLTSREKKYKYNKIYEKK